jgi:hypothetical protein
MIMTIEEMKRKIIEYYEQECLWARDALDRNLAEPWEIIHNAEQRMLGVFYFIKTLGVYHSSFEMLWYDYAKKLEDLIEEN